VVYNNYKIIDTKLFLVIKIYKEISTDTKPHLKSFSVSNNLFSKEVASWRNTSKFVCHAPDRRFFLSGEKP